MFGPEKGAALLSFLLIRPAPVPRYYRVAVEYTLFGDYSVQREWGKSGRKGAAISRWYSNLRDAVFAAEACKRAAQRKGYDIKEVTS